MKSTLDAKVVEFQKKLNAGCGDMVCTNATTNGDIRIRPVSGCFHAVPVLHCPWKSHLTSRNPWAILGARGQGRSQLQDRLAYAAGAGVNYYAVYDPSWAAVCIQIAGAHGSSSKLKTITVLPPVSFSFSYPFSFPTRFTPLPADDTCPSS